jgi:hypothetical protein
MHLKSESEHNSVTPCASTPQSGSELTAARVGWKNGACDTRDSGSAHFLFSEQKLILKMACVACCTNICLIFVNLHSVSV